MTTTRRFGLLVVAAAALAACGKQPTLSQLQVSPVVSEVTENLQARVSATAVYSDGTTRDVTSQVQWSSQDAAVAAPAADGLVQAGAPGRTYLVAAFGGLQATARVDVVAARLLSLVITTDDPTLPTGVSARAVALGTFSDGTVRDVTASVEWSASAPSIQVLGHGHFRAVDAGLASLSASLAGASATAQVEVVEASVVLLEAIGLDPTMPVGLVAPVTVMARFSDGSVRDVTADAVLGTANAALAVVESGRFRGVAAGHVDLTIAFAGAFSAVPVDVSQATLDHLLIEASATTQRSGHGVVFTATGTFTDGSVADLTDVVTWTTGSPLVAIISNAFHPGAALALLPGETAVTATDPVSGLSASVTLTVVP